MEVFVLDGLDDAILGTAVCNGVEVLVYNGFVVEKILEVNDFDVQTVPELFDYYEMHELGEYAPIFMYVDEDIAGIIKDAKQVARSTH